MPSTKQGSELLSFEYVNINYNALECNHNKQQLHSFGVISNIYCTASFGIQHHQASLILYKLVT